MNKALVLSALAMLAIVGCGKKEEVTVTGPDGTKVTASQDGNNVSVTDDKGNTTNMSTDDKGNISVTTAGGGVNATVGGVSEADLGLPFYTGSTETPNGSAKTDVGGKQVVASTRTTKDDPSKVIEFYKDKVKKAMAVPMVDSGGSKVGSLTGELENGSTVAIGATKTGDQDTQVVVTVTSK